MIADLLNIWLVVIALGAIAYVLALILLSIVWGVSFTMEDVEGRVETSKTIASFAKRWWWIPLWPLMALVGLRYMVVNIRKDLHDEHVH